MLNVSVQIGQKNKLMTKEILRIMLYEIVVLHRTIGRWLCSLDKVTYINNFGKSKDTPLQHNIANGDKNSAQEDDWKQKVDSHQNFHFEEFWKQRDQAQ